MRPLFHFRDSTELAASTAPLQDKKPLRRQALFHEPMTQRLQRIAYALAYLFMPKRLSTLPALTWEVLASLRHGRVATPTDARLMRGRPTDPASCQESERCSERDLDKLARALHELPSRKAPAT